MTDQTDAGGAIAVRPPAEIHPIPVPRQLQELGVRIGADESGHRVVYLPPELRQVVNVVNPTTSYVQADPNWTPGISLVTIDVERDTYNVAGKRGLGKQALETLSKAAGVLYTRTVRVPREELTPGELYAYRATVGFRRSDGTIDEITRDKGWIEEVERAAIEDDVANAKADRDAAPGSKYPTPEARAAEVRKRWLAELRFGPAKTESKAINRALRAGLSIPTSLTPADARKPFLVVGYNFTPDYSDPEVKRALVAVGLNAHAAIYGGREISNELPEVAGGDVPGTATPRDGVEDVAGASSDDAGHRTPVAPTGAVSGGDAEQDGGGGTDAAAADSSDDEPRLDDDEEPRDAFAPPAAAVEAAGATKVSVGQGKDANGNVLPPKVMTVAEAVAKSVARAEAGQQFSKTWAGWAIKNLEDGVERSAIELYVRATKPELWAQHEAGLEAA